MSTTDLEERPSGEPEPAGDGTSEARDEVRSRWVLPILLPVLAFGTLAVLAFNLSRVFLAGGKTGAMIGASVVTIVVLAGAAFLSSKPNMRTSSLTMLGAIGVLVVIGAGLTTIGAADEHHGDDEAGYVEPEGDPDETFAVEAVGLTFRPDTGSVGAGIILVELNGDPGHSFRIDDPEVEGFRLAGTGVSGKVQLGAGEYEFYCDIGNHREQGMEGVLTVAPGAEGDGTTAPDETEGP